jgi:hypothetical protein
MIDPCSQADQILAAELSGEARRHAKRRELTEAEHATAMAALREIAAGRGDLLAEVAGLAEGCSERRLDERPADAVLVGQVIQHESGTFWGEAIP